MSATPEQRARFVVELRAGCSIAEAGRRCGVSDTTARKWKKELVSLESDPTARKHWSQTPLKSPITAVGEADLPDPVPLDQLGENAQRGLEDFSFFSKHYLGRMPMPWRQETADRILELYATEEREYVVMNAPPGSGKTVLFTHDIPLWLTVRDRAIRGILGSWGEKSAKNFTTALRRTLGRTSAPPVPQKFIDRGHAYQPQGVIARDYGRFKPLTDDVWAAQAFIVEQADGTSVYEKEPTWTAFGQGSTVSWRVDFMLYDDLVTLRDMKSETKQEDMQRWWDDEVEERLEPAGLCILQGQRFGNELYKYNIDKSGLDEYDLEEMGIDPDKAHLLGEDRIGKQYHHIVFKAHYEEKCDGTQHDLTSAPYPEGCLLVPHRLSWRKCKTAMKKPERWATVYQQQDTDPGHVLVPMDWIKGGTVDGEEFVGCWDGDRDAWQMPDDVNGPFVPIVSVDPSPTKQWAVQGWCVWEDQEVELRRGPTPIREVRPGDLALTRLGWKPVRHVTRMGVKPTIDLGLSNGQSLRVTVDHKIATPAGWVPAGELPLGASLCGLAPVALEGALPASASSAPVDFVPDYEVVPREGVPVLAVSSVEASDCGPRSQGVLASCDGLQMARVDARGIPTHVVDGEAFWDWANEYSIRQTVGKALPAPTADSSVSVLVPTQTPLPAAESDLAPRLNVSAVIDDRSGFVDLAIGAGLTSQGSARNSGSAVEARVHLESISPGPEVPTYDMGVEGCHEFAAAGVVVHNCYAPDSDQYFLIDLFRGQMEAPDFLYGEGREFSGLLEQWRVNFKHMGYPLKHVILEKNVAQRFLLQYKFVKDWQSKYDIRVFGHETHHRNKSDPDYGIEMLRPLFQFGKIRLPGKQHSTKGDAHLYTGRRNALKLVDEVTRYSLTHGPGGTDDQVMAAWIMAHKAKSLRAPDPALMPRLNQHLPGWLVGRPKVAA